MLNNPHLGLLSTGRCRILIRPRRSRLYDYRIQEKRLGDVAFKVGGLGSHVSNRLCSMGIPYYHLLPLCNALCKRSVKAKGVRDTKRFEL